jgi:hypothetical protein
MLSRIQGLILDVSAPPGDEFVDTVLTMSLSRVQRTAGEFALGRCFERVADLTGLK